MANKRTIERFVNGETIVEIPSDVSTEDMLLQLIMDCQYDTGEILHILSYLDPEVVDRIEG